MKKQKGYTIAEIIMVVSIMVGVIALAFTVNRIYLSDAEYKATADEVRVLADKIEMAYAAQYDFSTLTVSKIWDEAPSSLQESGRTLKHKFGGSGSLSVAPEPYGGPPNRPSFRIVLNGLGKVECTALAGLFSPYFESITVDGNEIRSNPTEATNRCGASAPLILKRTREVGLVKCKDDARTSETACPWGFGGKIFYTAKYSCASGYEPGTWGSPVETGRVCTIAAANGVCGSATGTATRTYPTANFCQNGNKRDVDTIGNDGQFDWGCSGINGGSETICSAPKMEDGLCGGANGRATRPYPTSSLCIRGSESPVDNSGIDGSYNWECSGVNGGNPMSCSAPKIQDGICGGASGVATRNYPSANYCQLGSKRDVDTTGSDGNYDWGCSGVNGGLETICSAPKTEDGLCGSANGTSVVTAPTSNLCSIGSASVVAGTGPWTWTCAGPNGGSSASCSALAQPVNGACGTANGKATDSAPTSNLCSSGNASSVSSTLAHANAGLWNYSWTCSGLNAGTNASCKTLEKRVCGRFSPYGNGYTEVYQPNTYDYRNTPLEDIGWVVQGNGWITCTDAPVQGTPIGQVGQSSGTCYRAMPGTPLGDITIWVPALQQLMCVSSKSGKICAIVLENGVPSLKAFHIAQGGVDPRSVANGTNFNTINPSNGQFIPSWYFTNNYKYLSQMNGSQSFEQNAKLTNGVPQSRMTDAANICNQY